MKNILALLFLSVSFFGFSQIKVLKNENLTIIGKGNSITLYKKQNKYLINYQDINNSNLNTFRTFYFHDINKDFDELYKIISSGFVDVPTAEISLELPNDLIGLNFKKNYGETTVQFVHYINKSKKYIGKTQFYSKYQIDKLFGKKVEKPIKNKNKISDNN